MIMTVIENGVHWEVLGRLFKIREPTFKRIISKFVVRIFNELYAVF